MRGASDVERALGSGALAGVLGLHLPVFSDLPADARSVVLGAVGAGLSVVVARLAGAIADAGGRTLEAVGRRAARAIDPQGAREVVAVEAAPEGAAVVGERAAARGGE